LAVFPHMETILASRKSIVDCYDTNLDFSTLRKIKIRENTQWNYSYYPVVFETEEQLLQVQKALNEQKIFPRRYFYPSLNTIPYVDKVSMPFSESVASRILCLPLSHDLATSDAQKIVQLINSYLAC
jgi:dTDP-4-amino-4,6-dideoxygalactose transaminase